MDNDSQSVNSVGSIGSILSLLATIIVVYYAEIYFSINRYSGVGK